MLKKASWICRHYDSSTYELSDILPFSGDGIRDACSMEACLVGHWEENSIMNIAQSSRAELEMANWEEDERRGRARPGRIQVRASKFCHRLLPTHPPSPLSASKDSDSHFEFQRLHNLLSQHSRLSILRSDPPNLHSTTVGDHKNSNRRRISRHAPRCANTANMSLTNCRFYEEKYPEIDSFVMVNVKQVSPSRDIWEV